MNFYPNVFFYYNNITCRFMIGSPRIIPGAVTLAFGNKVGLHCIAVYCIVLFTFRTQPRRKKGSSTRKKRKARPSKQLRDVTVPRHFSGSTSRQ